MVGVVEALAHPDRSARRLLEMATTWSNNLPPSAPDKIKYRTARQLRPAEIDQLVEAFMTGKSVQELATRFEVHRSTIGRHLRERGVDTQPYALRPEDAHTAADLYRAGWTVPQVAKHYSIGNETARARIVAEGAKMRPQGRPARHP